MVCSGRKSADLYSVGTEGKMHLVYLMKYQQAMTLQMREDNIRYFMPLETVVSLLKLMVIHTMLNGTGGKVVAPSPVLLFQLTLALGRKLWLDSVFSLWKAMKMEMPLLSTEVGIVSGLHCLPNQQVSVGDVLISLQSQVMMAPKSKSHFPESTQPPIPSCAKDVQKEHSAVLEGVAFTILKAMPAKNLSLNKFVTSLRMVLKE